ncbi:MAG: BBP7 family outer membrane beta-barrel protein [Thermoguttaceae bacterium]
MTSLAHSTRTLILAGMVAVALGCLAVAQEPCADGNCENCSKSCNNWWEQTDSCSDCIGGLDTACCGDMTPLALCPDGRWYVKANLIALRRDAGQDEVFQTRNVNELTSREILTAGGASLNPRVFVLESDIRRDPVLSTSDLDFQFAAGYEMMLGFKLAECYALEFSYFDVTDWDETAVVSDDNTYDVDGTVDVNGTVTVTDSQPYSLFSPFSGFGDPTVEVYDFNDLASIRYRTSLDNVELNVRHWLIKRPSRMNVSVIWGARYNSVSERFNYFSTSPVPGADTTNAADITTDNKLWGVQLGGQVNFCWDPGWYTEFEIKGGVAHNRAEMTGAYDLQEAGGPGGVGGLIGYDVSDEKDVTSFIGQMRLDLVYQFGPHLSTHIGYEALVLADVALASRNFETDQSILADGPWVINSGGSVVYHGPTFGLTCAW